MERHSQDNEVLKHYLLGELEPERQRHVEEKLLAEGKYLEELLMAEDELIDNYLAGSLSQSEQAKFDDHFLLTSERQQKLRFAKTFRQYVANAANAESPDSVDHIPHAALSRQLLPSFLQALNPLTRFPLAAALLLTVIFSSLLISNYTLQRAGDTQEMASDTGQASSTILVALTPGLVRDAGELKRVNIPPGAGRVQFRLESASDGYNNYRAILLAEGREILTLDQLKAEASDGAKAVTLVLPARLLTQGDFQLKLSGQTAGGEFEDVNGYSFRVSNK